MKKIIRYAAIVLPHVSIVISAMYIVFYYINNVNSAMKFLDPKDTPATFILLLLLSVSSIVCSAVLIYYRRKAERLEHEMKNAESTDETKNGGNSDMTA